MRTNRCLARSLLAAIARLPGDSSGASAAVVVMALPCLIGFGALGVETGAWFTIELRNQSAVDAAAISAAYETIAGKINVFADLTAAANEAATGNGYTGTTPVVSYPYNDAVVGNGVAVTLEQTQGTLLAAMFLSTVTVVNKAVAVSEVLDNPCLLALGTAGTDVALAASVNLSMPDCSIVANSIGSAAIALDSSSLITAAALVTAGEISVDGNPIDPGAPPPELSLGTTAMIGAPAIADPYASTLTHTYLTAGMPTLTQCIPSGPASGAITYSNNCFVQGAALQHSSVALTGNTQISGGWTIKADQTVDLSPGTYWITGDLTIQSNGVLKCSTCNNVNGSGVTIILTGTVSMAAGAVLNLNAPASGPFSGMVMLQDPSLASGVNSITGAALNGLVYFPNSSLIFDGNLGASGPRCLLLVANSVQIDANSSLESGGCAQAGLANLPTVLTVALAE
jgi:hypothetical protein